jgi:class 3 adenylate cyclase
MAQNLSSELTSEVAKFFRDRWTTRDGNVVPKFEDVKMGNEGVNLNATALYADLAESTNLVDSYKPWFAAEIYKSYLFCAGKIIRAEGGEITAYDGDRVMAIFIGDTKNTSAVRAALKIHHAVRNIINPAILKAYPSDKYSIKQVVGIDTSRLMAARTGVKGDNDLVWVGRAANHAAKLSGLAPTHATRITEQVFKVIADEAKFSAQGQLMWQQVTWNGRNIYRSNFWWRF